VIEAADGEAFIRANTELASPPLLPWLRLHLATEITPIWQATETRLSEAGLAPPYWAFAWAGGQALARWVADHPDQVAGRRVLDFGAGSGLVAIAASLAGAAASLAVDIDPLAGTAARLNAEINRAAIETRVADLIGTAVPADLILVGDLCYERPLADRLIDWLRTRVAAGTSVLIGDPGRTYLPAGGKRRLASYGVPTSLELEDRTLCETTIWQLEA
jgi:predicted nicotinamide N-methyase